MLRASLLIGMVVAFSPAAGAAEEPSQSLDLHVLKPAGDAQTPPAHEMLHRYLLDQARQQFDARRKAIAAIKTPEDIARRQKALRAFFLQSLGDLPERTPLNPRVVGTLPKDGYRVEKVDLREPAGAPRHGQPLPARRQAAVPRRAPALRPQRQRQGGRDAISGRASCWRGTAWPSSATTRSARASDSSASMRRASR